MIHNTNSRNSRKFLCLGSDLIEIQSADLKGAQTLDLYTDFQLKDYEQNCDETAMQQGQNTQSTFSCKFSLTDFLL